MSVHSTPIDWSLCAYVTPVRCELQEEMYSESLKISIRYIGVLVMSLLRVHQDDE
uniref:AlNc14C33G3044 protein n=1 Tax=Albugo laibachii Nc14 TaxID=890382 RepID=F0W884_9STRA|nr:AlNc14C33G3044 [Albugo laibachii Nc14]|eukprot:CCA17368.1 AlNc14C33G3044 [Albugo laibachii Nc14]